MLRDRIDYSTYRAGIAEKLLCSVVGSAIGILIGYTFYEHVIAATICAIAVSVYANQQYIKLRTESAKATHPAV